MNYEFRKKDKGVIALATILLLSIIIVEIGLVSAFVVYTLNNINYGSRLSAEALVAARSGIDDVAIRLARNPAYANPYVLSVGSRMAIISITSSSGKATVVSEGVAFNKHRKVQAIFDLDSATGIVHLVSQKELSFP